MATTGMKTLTCLVAALFPPHNWLMYCPVMALCRALPDMQGPLQLQRDLLPTRAAQDMLIPELCRRQLTLTCLDNDDVLPVTQLQHLTWCASFLHTLQCWPLCCWACVVGKRFSMPFPFVSANDSQSLVLRWVPTRLKDKTPCPTGMCA